MPLEIACFTPSSAIAAARAGADRIELCADYAAGGITPSLSTLENIHTALTSSPTTTNSPSPSPAQPLIPIHIMIRPAPGPFTPSASEFHAMKSEIRMFKSHTAVKGFVFGILTSSLLIDSARNRELVDLAAPLPCTFHRALDEVDDLDGAVEDIIGCGFTSVLTSGGEGSAVEGRDRVRGLQGRFGGRVCFVFGGGVRSGNLREVMGAGVEWVHSAAITGEGEEVNGEEVRRMVEILRTRT